MTIIKVEPEENGYRENQTIYNQTPETWPIPTGFALFPDELGDFEHTPHANYCEITVETIDGLPTVTSWTPLPVPEPEPMPEPDPSYTPVTWSALAASIKEGVNEV